VVFLKVQLWALYNF